MDQGADGVYVDVVEGRDPSYGEQHGTHNHVVPDEKRGELSQTLGRCHRPRSALTCWTGFATVAAPPGWRKCPGGGYPVCQNDAVDGTHEKLAIIFGWERLSRLAARVLLCSMFQAVRW
jgi:hypothetical protein